MQIFVCGMHRSGTSLLTGLLNMMGCYFGPEGKMMPPNAANPKGYWERLDVLEINQALLKASHGYWSKLSAFQPTSIPSEALERLSVQMRQLLLEMDAHRPWVLKDPRFCLTFRWWKPLLSLPVVIFPLRHPIEIARSLRVRDGIPVAIGLILWEEYMRNLLPVLSGLPVLTSRYDDVLDDPSRSVKHLFESLKEFGVEGLRMPSLKELDSFSDRSLRHQTHVQVKHDDWGNKNQRQLWAYLEEGDWLKASTWMSETPDENNLLELKAFEHVFEARWHLNNVKQKEENLKQELEIQQNKGIQLEKSCEEIKKENQHTLFLYQKEMVDLKLSIAQRDHDLAEKQKENERFQGEIELLKATLEQHKTDYQQLHLLHQAQLKEKEEATHQLELLTSQVSSFQLEIDSLSQEKQECDEMNLELMEKLDTLKQFLTIQKEKITKSRQKIHALSEELQKTKKRIGEKNAIIGKMTNQNGQKQIYYSELEKNLSLYRHSLRYRLGNAPIDILTPGKKTPTALDNVLGVIQVLKKIDQKK